MPPTLAVWARIYKVKGVFELDTPKSEAGMRTIALPPHLAPIRRKHLGIYTEGDPDALNIHSRSRKSRAIVFVEQHARH